MSDEDPTPGRGAQRKEPRRHSAQGRRALTPMAGWLTVLTVVFGSWLSACSSSNPVLTFFFDGVPAAGQEQASRLPERPLRRQPYKAPPPAVIFVEIPDLPAPVDWRARFDALTRNQEGEVEWTRALNDRTIAPKPGISAEVKDYKAMDEDLEFIPKKKPKYKVLFRHLPHTQWLRCGNCHNAIFEKDHGAAEMTMAKLEEGLYCGACHGKVASPNLENCDSCHPK